VQAAIDGIALAMVTLAAGQLAGVQTGIRGAAVGATNVNGVVVTISARVPGIAAITRVSIIIILTITIAPTVAATITATIAAAITTVATPSGTGEIGRGTGCQQ
jgi:hypothetical protein